MNIQELTQAMHDLVSAHGWYAPGTSKPQLPRNLAISLSLEAAEVLEHFQWTDTARDNQALGAELADVALFLLQLASVCEIDLEAAILDKIKLNYTRVWPDESGQEAQ